MSLKDVEDLWLFGYGSLIWKPPPHFGPSHNSITSALDSLSMQTSDSQATSKAMSGGSGSEDHRGTPEAPGRVVTLIGLEHWKTLTDHHASAPERVWGAAYHFPPDRVAEVRDYLDIREINGYSIQYTPFHPAGEASESHGKLNCMVYIGLPDNPQFLGPQDPDVLARHILKSRGPSGDNKEYLYNLEQALVSLSKESGDEHISDLARRCKKLEEDASAQPNVDE